jgi:DNA-binding transcriptional LysR family regulator
MGSMEIKHARTFVTVAELGTVSKAAVRLRLTQPALSRQISGLEQELGLKLFDRVGRRLVLTGEGEQLLNDCHGLLSYASALGERAQLLKRGDTGVLKVAASPQFIEGAISNFWRHYEKRYPNVELKLIEAIGTDVLTLLERGEVHLGQQLVDAVAPGDRRFASHPLASVDLLAACHPSLALGHGKEVDIGDLAPYRLLLLDGSFIFRRTFDAACRLCGFEPSVKFESQAPHTLLAMAEDGHGVAIIPSTLRTQRYQLRILGLTYKGKALRQPLTMYWDKRRPLPPYAAAFCEMLATYVREVFPITRPSGPRIGGKARSGKPQRMRTGRPARRGGRIRRG